MRALAQLQLDLLDDLYDVLIRELVLASSMLRLMLDRSAPHHRMLELIQQRAMDALTEVGDGAFIGWHDDWLVIVLHATAGLGVDANQIE